MHDNMIKPLILTIGSFFALSADVLDLVDVRTRVILTIVLIIWWSFKVIEFICKKVSALVKYSKKHRNEHHTEA